LLKFRTVETLECPDLSKNALSLMSENEISLDFTVGKLLRSGKDLFPKLNTNHSWDPVIKGSRFVLNDSRTEVRYNNPQNLGY